MSDAIFLGLLVVVFVLISWLTARFDHDRIRKDIESRGGKVLNIDRNFFAPGWFGRGSQMSYDVRYKAMDGRIITSTCVTSMFGGVYWKHAPPDDSGLI